MQIYFCGSLKLTRYEHVHIIWTVGHWYAKWAWHGMAEGQLRKNPWQGSSLAHLRHSGIERNNPRCNSKAGDEGFPFLSGGGRMNLRDVLHEVLCVQVIEVSDSYCKWDWDDHSKDCSILFPPSVCAPCVGPPNGFSLTALARQVQTWGVQDGWARPSRPLLYLDLQRSAMSGLPGYIIKHSNIVCIVCSMLLQSETCGRIDQLQRLHIVESYWRTMAYHTTVIISCL